MFKLFIKLKVFVLLFVLHQLVDGYGYGYNRQQSRPWSNFENYENEEVTDEPEKESLGYTGPDEGHCGRGYACRNIASCFNQFPSLELIEEHRCPLIINGHNTRGVCCPHEIITLPSDYALPYRFDPPRWPKRKLGIEQRDIAKAVEITENRVLSFLEMEIKLLSMGYKQVQNTMEAQHQAVFGPPDQSQQTLNLNGFRALEVTRLLRKKFNLDPIEARDGLTQSLHGTAYERYCLPIPRCNPGAKYRTIDGSCNNLENPLYGKSSTQFSRILPPAYADGLSEFRLSVSGNELPKARLVSTEAFQTGSKLSPKFNVMFMQWGQLIDHDLTLGSSTRATTGEGLLCCNQTHPEEPVLHPACKPILVSRDQFYSRFRVRCLNFVRNAVGPRNGCQIGSREQTNVITAFLDASMVYGNEVNRTQFVRAFRDGLLKVSHIGRKRTEFLPYDTMNNSLACTVPRNVRIPDAESRCVFTGDQRNNQQFGIVSLQLLLLREHNRLVRALKKVNPYWSDDSLFLEARRIVGAIMQHITYNEWLPIALGRSVMKEHGLLLTPSGQHCGGYDPKINPAIMNEFAAAAFRWHTLVQDHYETYDAEGRPKRQFKMNQIFNNPSFLYRDGAIDELNYGMLAQKGEAFDNIAVDDIKNTLFPSRGAKFGLDLIAINIQRGRDHGTPPYNAIRKVCGLPIIKHWRQLDAVMMAGTARRLSRIYEHVDDIDFYVGGVNERPLPDGILGPTFSCLTAEQFRRVKLGDRFWYENGGMPHSFSIEQLDEIRKVSLAGIICANGDNVRVIQPFAMLPKSQSNLNIDCKQIPQINIDLWKNEKVF